ncbi:hypothetical protein LMG22037_06174 [Paraburkholderia phenoliruptrix]|jgi:hypothetical protein|uniref:Uncharacterized protein n=1 Tax=Paraburkholderia phenoliruptrix TaxID=252970 RepID=A0A6J5CJ28_9BURK|nr:hypothetical protein [Paraburkholderia phenoliruptrix]CAB3737725.1 hypothetical protein LMG22037_06174 [Paraburkholderia phenoliruptrix]
MTNMHLKAVVFDETRYCSDDLVASASAGGRIYRTYLFDAELAVHCCELTPSFELWPMYTTPLEDDEEGHVHEQLLAGEDHEIRYYQQRAINSMRPEFVQDLGFHQIDDDETRDEAFERCLEHYRGNVVLETPRFVQSISA